MILVKATMIILFWISLESTILLASATAATFKFPSVQKGTNLFDCKVKLDKQGGGWCEISLPGKHPSISAVWPPDLDDKTFMASGPSSVLDAWNGAAFDEKSLLIYFMGGGHTDYGGNEIYEFDLKNGSWARLTNPSPLSFFVQTPDEDDVSSTKCWVPDLRKVPGASHTYDGLQFSKKTGTVFLLADYPADGSCFNSGRDHLKGDPRLLSEVSGIFEFNPSRHKTRNSLTPLTWRRLTTPDDLNLDYPRSLELPDGTMMIGNSKNLYSFNPSSGIIGKHLLEEEDLGDGLAEYHPKGLIISLHHDTLVINDLKTKVSKMIDAPHERLHGKSLAVDNRGKVFSWDGRERILMFNMNNPELKWILYDWTGAGPPSGNKNVYSKWQYLAAHDVFIGLSYHTTGVWIYKHPAAMSGVELSRVDPDSLISKAKPGSVVSLPPGYYGKGLYIDKSLKVKLQDVRLLGVAEDKAIINVDCDDCKVVIEDFYGEGNRAVCLEENCAGIKAEGSNFHLTVRRAHLGKSIMGILTDDRGGRLVVEDSLIEDTVPNNQSDTLGHGLYAGNIDSLIMRRSTIRNVNSSGHLLKSRAKETILENVSLLGEKGFHSRSIDLPCGGVLRIKDSIIQHGINSENNDVIAMGAEPDDCIMTPLRVFITKSWIINDRIKNLGESNILFNWFMPHTALELRNNYIVNMDKWSEGETNESANADFNFNNKICQNRAICGLTKDQLPTP